MAKTFEEWWLDEARDESSDYLDLLDLGLQAILAGWVKKAWHARDAEVDKLQKRIDAARAVAQKHMNLCGDGEFIHDPDLYERAEELLAALGEE